MMKMQPLSPGVLVLSLAALIGTPASAQDIGLSALFADVTGLAVAVDEQDSLAGKTVFAQCRVCPSTDGTNSAGPNSSGSRKARSFFGFRGSSGVTGVPVTRDEKTPDADITRAGTSH
jgi:cytochrome c2